MLGDQLGMLCVYFQRGLHEEVYLLQTGNETLELVGELSAVRSLQKAQPARIVATVCQKLSQQFHSV
jgi:hypothetical protein